MRISWNTLHELCELGDAEALRVSADLTRLHNLGRTNIYQGVSFSKNNFWIHLG